MTVQEKKQATVYILLQLAEWYKEEGSNIDTNDLSILKSLKLFFLLSTVNLDKEGQNLIDLGFSKYIAMPFGPVESDVYDFFKEENYINKSKLDYNVLKLEDISNLKEAHKSVINNCLQELKSINKNIIKFSASLLVDLTHKYSSWIISYNHAVSNSWSTKEMSNDRIRAEEKFYFI